MTHVVLGEEEEASVMGLGLILVEKICLPAILEQGAIDRLRSVIQALFETCILIQCKICTICLHACIFFICASGEDDYGKNKELNGGEERNEELGDR